jgi:hypothetical protein
MTPRQLYRSVAQATGESRATIRRLGFRLEDVPSKGHDHPPHLALECPGCGRAVPLGNAGRPGLPELAECGGCEAAYPYQHDEIFVWPAVA